MTLTTVQYGLVDGVATITLNRPESRNALNRDFEQVIAAIKSGAIPTDALHTHSLAAVDLPDGLPKLIAEADHVLKAIAHF
jgi:threonine dehydrogenase-like Zn-dependent dehydrogenase